MHGVRDATLTLFRIPPAQGHICGSLSAQPCALPGSGAAALQTLLDHFQRNNHFARFAKVRCRDARHTDDDLMTGSNDRVSDENHA